MMGRGCCGMWRCLVFAVSMAVPFSSFGASNKFVSIGTGGLTGVYYPTGEAIAKLVNKQREAYGIKCTAESTSGSVFNINSVIIGDMEFGIAQSDRQYQAWHGTAEWESRGPQKRLRSVFSVHAESVTLVAAHNAGIVSVKDLRGKRVNIGNHGSGHRQNAIDALRAVGIDHEEDVLAENVKAAEAPGLLKDHRIDAFFYTVGHPSGAIKEVTAGGRAVGLVALPEVAKLLSARPYYSPTIIPVRFYPGATNTEDVPTFGVKATVITSAQVSDEIVYAVTKEVFRNLEEFKSLHPSYELLTAEGMLQGLSAPIHPGAMRYFEEAGLLKYAPAAISE